MQLTLTPTDRIEHVDGSPHRVWTGITDKNVPIEAWIRVVQPQTHDAEALADFDRELQALPKPRRTAVIADMRFIL
jgi:hypothetical protein